MTDTIADMLTRIRNAGRSKFSSVEIPNSKIKTELAKTLKNEGYIRNYKLIHDGKQGILKIFLKYDGPGQTHSICHIERVSKPGRRVYIKSKDIKSYLHGMGVTILTTSKGILTDKQAKKENVGGEVLLKIW